MKHILCSLIFVAITVCSWVLQAQSWIPRPPSWPEDPKQCQAFSSDVEKYRNELDKKHDACLAAGKPDHPNIPQDSPLCTRDACQPIHDQLLGNAPLGVKELQRQVDDCYKKVNQHLAEEAKKKHQKEEEERRRKQQEDEDSRRNNERLAADVTRRHELEEQERRRGLQQAQGNSAQKQPSQNQPANHAAVPASSQQAPVTQQPASQDASANQKGDTVAALKEPFGKAQKAAISLGLKKPDLYDPFAGSAISKNSGKSDAALPDPFSGDASDASDSEKEDPSVNEFKEHLGPALHKGFDMVKDAIEDTKAQAKQQFTPYVYKKFAKDADEAISRVSGIGYVMDAFEYANIGRDIYEAETPQARREEEKRLALQIGKDAGTRLT